MKTKTIRDIDPAGKHVLVRVDFNVPFDVQGAISDNTRIVAALPTIKMLIESRVKVILMSHLGRPKGERVPQYSLKPIAAELGELLGKTLLLLMTVLVRT